MTEVGERKAETESGGRRCQQRVSGDLLGVPLLSDVLLSPFPITALPAHHHVQRFPARANDCVQHRE